MFLKIWMNKFKYFVAYIYLVLYLLPTYMEKKILNLAGNCYIKLFQYIKTFDR